MYGKTDQTRARHFPEHAVKGGRKAEPLFLAKLGKYPILSEQVEKSGVGNRFIYPISSILLTLINESDNSSWKNRNLLSIPTLSAQFFIDKDRQIAKENQSFKRQLR